MTIAEAVKALDIVEHMESFSILYEPGEPMNQTTVGELKEACRMAISTLRAQVDAPPNNPLTLEELREMDREPIWCRVGPGQWGIINKFVDKVVFFNGGTIPIAHLEGRAYRRKPEEATP